MGMQNPMTANPSRGEEVPNPFNLDEKGATLFQDGVAEARARGLAGYGARRAAMIHILLTLEAKER